MPGPADWRGFCYVPVAASFRTSPASCAYTVSMYGRIVATLGGPAAVVVCRVHAAGEGGHDCTSAGASHSHSPSAPRAGTGSGSGVTSASSQP